MRQGLGKLELGSSRPIVYSGVPSRLSSPHKRGNELSQKYSLVSCLNGPLHTKMRLSAARIIRSGNFVLALMRLGAIASTKCILHVIFVTLFPCQDKRLHQILSFEGIKLRLTKGYSVFTRTPVSCLTAVLMQHGELYSLVRSHE